MADANILEIIIEYLKNSNPIIKELEEVPLDESLVELGYMDSFGVVDIVIYLEGRFEITINDDDITRERFGSIRKMAKLVFEKAN